MSYRADLCRQIIELDEAREKGGNRLKELEDLKVIIRNDPMDNRVLYYNPAEIEDEITTIIKDCEEKENQIKNLIRML